MKKITYFAALFAAFAMFCASLVSCHKDDDVSADPKDLVGTWKLVQFVEYYHDEDGTQEIKNLKYDNENEQWELLTFEEDNTWFCDCYKKREYYQPFNLYQ